MDRDNPGDTGTDGPGSPWDVLLALGTLRGIWQAYYPWDWGVGVLTRVASQFMLMKGGDRDPGMVTSLLTEWADGCLALNGERAGEGTPPLDVKEASLLLDTQLGGKETRA